MIRYSALLLLVLVIVAIVVTGRGSASVSTSSPPPTPSTATALADITLRTGPGFDFAETAAVFKGTTLSLLGSAPGRNCHDWVLVRTSAGEQGWVMPALVNVDLQESVLPPAPTPTLTAPLPTTCTAGLALLQIDNQVGKTLEVYMTGPEPGFSVSVDHGEVQLICLTPGEYCYDLTDGNKHATGALYFPGDRCTCWHWGGGPPQGGSCQCSTDPGNYRRP